MLRPPLLSIYIWSCYNDSIRQLIKFIIEVNLICDLSENPHSSHNFRIFFLLLSIISTGSFEVIALDSQASMKISLYNNHTDNKLQAFTFAANNLSFHLPTALGFSLKFPRLRSYSVFIPC